MDEMELSHKRAIARLTAERDGLRKALEDSIVFMVNAMEARGDHGVSILIKAARAALSPSSDTEPKP